MNTTMSAFFCLVLPLVEWSSTKPKRKARNMAPVAETKLPSETPKSKDKDKTEESKKEDAKKEKEEAEMVLF